VTARRAVMASCARKARGEIAKESRGEAGTSSPTIWAVQESNL
jgi:hypothetical protein